MTDFSPPGQTEQKTGVDFAAGAANTIIMEDDQNRARAEFEFLPGIVGDLFFLLDRPANAVRGAWLESSYESGNPFVGAYRGLMGHDPYHFSTYWGSSVGSFATEVLTDPLLFTGGGFTKSAGKAVAASRRLTPELIKAGKASAIPFIGKVGVNPFKPGSTGVSLTHAADKILRATGFNGLAKFGEIEARIFKSSGSLRTSLLTRTSIAEKRKILQETGNAFRSHIGNTSDGKIASIKSLFNDFDKIVDRNTRALQTREMIRKNLPEFAKNEGQVIRGSRILMKAIDEIQATGGIGLDPVRIGFDMTKDEILSTAMLFAENLKTAPDAARAAFAKDESLFATVVRRLTDSMDWMLHEEQAAGVLTATLGGNPELAASLIKNLERTWSAYGDAGKALGDAVKESGFSRESVKGALKKAGLKGKERRGVQRDLAEIGKGLSFKDTAAGYPKLLSSIDDYFQQKLSATQQEIFKHQTYLDQVPGYMEMKVTDAGRKLLDIPMTGKGKFRKRWLRVDDEFQLQRKHIWNREFAKKMEPVLGYRKPEGVPMTHFEANAGYRAGAFGKQAVDFDVFNMDPVKAFHSRMTHGGRLVTSANLLKRAGTQFGKEATGATADALVKQGWRKANFEKFPPLSDTLFPPEVANELERFVPMFGNKTQQGFLISQLQNVTQLWRDMTLFSAWRAVSFSSRNWMTDVSLNWMAGMNASNVAGTARAYHRGFLAVAAGAEGGKWDTKLLRMMGSKGRGQKGPIRLGVFDNIDTLSRDNVRISEFLAGTNAAERSANIVHKELDELVRSGIVGKHPTLGDITFDELMAEAGNRGVLHGGLSRSFQEMTADIAGQAALDGANAGTDLLAHKINSTFKPLVGNAGKVAKHILGRGPDALGKKLATGMENHTRVSHFIFNLFENGMDWDEAAESVLAWHASKFVPTKIDSVLGNTFPFYSWMRFNIPNVTKLLAEKPALFAGMARATDFAMRGAEIGDEDFPDWMERRGGLPVKRIKDEETGQEYFGVIWAGSIIPLTDIYNFDSGSEMWQYIADNMNEPVKSVVEVAMGYDVGTRRPLNPKTATFMQGQFMVPDIGPIRGDSLDHMLRAWSAYNFVDRMMGDYATPEAERRSSRTRGTQALAAFNPFTLSRIPVEQGTISNTLLLKSMKSEIEKRIFRDANNFRTVPEVAQASVQKQLKKLQEILNPEPRGLRGIRRRPERGAFRFSP